MKRILVISVVVIVAISALKHHRARRRAERTEHETRWSWPDDSLTPRPHESKKTSLRFANTHSEVKITADPTHGVRIVVNSDDQPQADCPDGAVSPPPAGANQPMPALVTSDLKYTEDRALADLKAKVTGKIAGWLAEANVPADWQPPQSLIDSTTAAKPHVAAEEKEYGTMYLASVPLNLSRPMKERFVAEYHRHVAGQRLGILGGGLAFILACLGIGVGYVRTDEATKGYYTNRLRLLAAAGVGAAGVVLYQWITRVA